MKEKQKFSIDVSAISDYKNELNPAMIQEMFFSKKSLDMFNKYNVPGIGTQTLNILDNTIYLQDTACGLEESGSTALTQRDLKVVAKTAKLKWCKSDFYQKWANYFMNNEMKEGAGQLEKQIVDSIISEIGDIVEKAIWQSTSGGTNHYDGFDGVIATLSAATCVDDTASVYNHTGLTSSNIDDVITDMIGNIPSAKLEKNLTLFLSPANILKAISAWADTYKYVIERTIDNKYTLSHPYMANLTLQGVQGLAGTNYMIITDPQNIYVPVTGNDEYVSFEYSYDVAKRDHLIFIDLILGTQVGRPEYVVTNFETN